MYNRALTQRGSITFWVDESAIEAWTCTKHHGKRGRGFQFSDVAIETAFMVKGVFSIPLRSLQGFIDSKGLKVFGEGEWKVKKHGNEKPRTWCQLHLAVDVDTHKIISAEMTLVNVGDSEVLPTLLNPLLRRI